MRCALIAILALAAASRAAERKPLPGQAGNDDLELSASVLLTSEEIHSALGADLGEGYFVVRLKATPKAEQPLRISPDDFTMISRKDGQRSEALAPSQIAGDGGALVVKTTSERGAGSQRRRTLGIGGIGGGASAGSTTGGGALDTSVETKEGQSNNPLLAALKEKAFPDKETKESLEGLLYFPIEGKIKASDVAILYKGPAGRLIIEFPKSKGGR